MIGVGRTVFQGAELEDFKVHIIGVLRNVQGPRRNLILARLEGGPLAQTGVAAGMSGSPVYVDGRLIGAVSYSIGAFSKEAIAGITPIQEMKDATAMSRAAPGTAGADRPAGDAREPHRGADGRLCAAGALCGTARRRPVDWPSHGGRRAARRDDAAHRHAAADGRLRARRRRRDRRRLPRLRLQPGDHRRHRAGRRSADRPAARGRRDRRVADRRRSRDGRDRHRHAHRRRPRLRLRASLLQSRPRRISDDPRARVHHAPQPDELVQDLQPRRDHRDDAAGSRDGDCRNAREGTGAGADDHHRQLHPRRRRASRSAAR